MTYKGVVVSLNPLKIPCIANVSRTAGAPNDLVNKYVSAGASIGEPYSTKNKQKECKSKLAFGYSFLSLYPIVLQ